MDSLAIFFLQVGLELKKEFIEGQLADFRRAIPPIFAALGGVAVPALLFFVINMQEGDLRGVGVPMATDIVFALGVLSLLGDRVPTSLRIFLMTLAVIDDLCAIVIIAVFYSGSVDFLNIGYTLGFMIIVFGLSRLKVTTVVIYVFGGVLMWYFMKDSGIHASVTGVLLAIVLPYSKDQLSVSHRLQRVLHVPVSFIVLPLFALANTAILVEGEMFRSMLSPVALGIFMGLCVGKPLGIFGATYLSVLAKFGNLSSSLRWSYILALVFLAE